MYKAGEVMQHFEPKVSIFNPKFVSSSFRKFLRSVYALGVVIIIIILASIYLVSTQNKNDSTANLPKGTSESQKATYESDHGRYSLAEQAWQAQIKSSSTTQDKLNIYFEEASTAIQFKKYSDARNYANEALSLDPNSSIPYVALANIALASGNKAQAKQYWQQAINKLNPNSPGYNITLNEYTYSLESIK